MPRFSAGLLLYRRSHNQLEVFLVHPGGPFWAKKNLGAWSIPKGEYSPEEDPLTAAKREFQEETGLVLDGHVVALGAQKQAGGKIICAWALEADFDHSGLKSNTFLLEWPPRSGRMVEFPEVDRWEWFSIDEAKKHILAGQSTFLDRLIETV